MNHSICDPIGVCTLYSTQDYLSSVDEVAHNSLYLDTTSLSTWGHNEFGLAAQLPTMLYLATLVWVLLGG